MTTPTPPIPVGANCRFDTASDTKWVRCITLQYGLDIVSSEDQGRLGRTFYPNHTDTHSFSVECIFTTYEEMQSVASWLQNYMQQVLNNTASSIRVRVPARNFDRQGVLAGGVTFGDKAAVVTYGMVLTFVGAIDAVINSSAPVLSKFVGAGTDYTEYGQFFYPAGVQLSGKESAPQFYDDVPTGATTQQKSSPASAAQQVQINNILGGFQGSYLVPGLITTYPNTVPSQPTGGAS